MTGKTRDVTNQINMTGNGIQQYQKEHKSGIQSSQPNIMEK